MGGSVKNIANTVGRGVSGVLTLGGSEIARNNLGNRNPISQALGLPGTIVTGGLSGGSQMPSVFGTNQGPNPYVGGPFSLDPAQVAADQEAITGMGGKQYNETLGAIDTAGKSAQDYAAQTFQRMLPTLAEDYNSGHLLNSTGYQQEAARQGSYLAQDVANQVAQQKLGALSSKQGFDTGALQRGLSLEDFINQANVSKSIGQAFAPQAPSGKQNFGTVAQGVGALAPLAALAAGGPGAAAGTQYVMSGANQGKKYGK